MIVVFNMLVVLGRLMIIMFITLSPLETSPSIWRAGTGDVTTKRVEVLFLVAVECPHTVVFPVQARKASVGTGIYITARAPVVHFDAALSSTGLHGLQLLRVLWHFRILADRHIERSDVPSSEVHVYHAAWRKVLFSVVHNLQLYSPVHTLHVVLGEKLGHQWCPTCHRLSFAISLEVDKQRAKRRQGRQSYSQREKHRPVEILELRVHNVNEQVLHSLNHSFCLLSVLRVRIFLLIYLLYRILIFSRELIFFFLLQDRYLGWALIERLAFNGSGVSRMGVHDEDNVSKQLNS